MERVQEVGQRLSGLGAKVSESARPGFSSRECHDTYLNLLFAFLGAQSPDPDHARNLRAAAGLDARNTSMDATMTRAMVLDHHGWMAHHNTQARLRGLWQDFFQEWDVVICPTLATTAFPHDHRPMPERTIRVNDADVPYMEQLFWAGLVTVGNLPSTVFPTGLSREGLPIRSEEHTSELQSH